VTKVDATAGTSASARYQNASPEAPGMLTHVGCAAASVTVGIVNGSATIRAAVKAAGRSRCVTADVDYQLLSWGNRDNGAHAPTIDYLGTGPFCTASIDSDLSHARGYCEIMRSAREIERFMVRKMVRCGVNRHDAVSGVTAAAYKHCHCRAKP
jgi:hypothetical protein